MPRDIRLAIEVGIFAALGQRLFGDHWKMAAAKRLGVRYDTINKIMRGRLPLRPGLLLKMQLLYEENINGNDDQSRRTRRVSEGGDSPHGAPDGGRE
jgi:hypothetical protein